MPHEPAKTGIATSVADANESGDSISELPGQTPLYSYWHTRLCGEQRGMQGVHV